MYRLASVSAAVAIALGAVGCGGDEPDKTAACALPPGPAAAGTGSGVGHGTGTATSAATVQDRKIIGAAAPYVADAGLAARDLELESSIAARRAAAWEVVAKVLAPVPLGESRLAANFPGSGPGTGQPSIPAWHTWYAREDFDRVFKHLYRGLAPAERRARAAIDPAAGLAWNATALDAIPEWPEQRYLDYLATITKGELAAGVGGASRVGYSPGAMGHLLSSYEPMHQCRLVPAPDAFAADPMTPGRRVEETDAMAVAKCGWHELGPYQAADGGQVVVSLSGDGDADLYVRRGEAPDAAQYDCKSSGSSSAERCTIAGGGPVYVAVFGAAETSTVTVTVEYTTADVVAPACLGTPMPRDAVLVKADWVRQLASELLPVFDTSGPRMASRLASRAEWNADGAADPRADAIYTVEIPGTQQRFRMPALHIMSKELDHWMWITLWWSPDPDTDFGADRPGAVAALTGPWRNYKMCVVSSYVERDPDPRGGFAGSLGDALAAVHGGVGAPSWCSNPYIEEGANNASTNCIGCHQHGGTELTAEKILADLPQAGTTRTRNNFFTDYLWAVKGGGGEDLSSVVQAEVDYWDANDP